MGSCADGTENFGLLVSVPKKLLLLFPEKNCFLKILTGITGFSIQIVGAKKTGAPKMFWIRPLGQ